jgi:hypothetical protein
MDAASPTQDRLLPTPIGELRRVYLQRLERLQRLRQRHEQELNHQGVRLLNRSIFEAYCMCREIGAQDEARAILERFESEPAA